MAVIVKRGTHPRCAIVLPFLLWVSTIFAPFSLAAPKTSELRAQLHWIDSKGELTSLDWRWFARWEWKKLPGGPVPEVPVLKVWIEYPAYFPLLGALDRKVIFQPPNPPYGNRPGYRTLLLEEREPLFTKTLYYRGAEGKKETGGLAITFSFNGPSLLIHDSCVKRHLELEPPQTAGLFYVGFYCESRKKSVDVTLLHSGDVAMEGKDFIAHGKGWKRIRLQANGESKQLQVGTKFSDSNGTHGFVVSTASMGRNEGPGTKIRAGLSPNCLTFKGGDDFSELTFVARLAADLPLGDGPWALKSEISVTPLALFGKGRDAPSGLYQVSARVKGPLRLGGIPGPFSFEVGPLLQVTNLPLKGRRSHVGFGPQFIVAMEWGKTDTRNYRFWGEVSFLGLDSASLSIDNPRLGLGLQIPLFSAMGHDWAVVANVTNTQFENVAAASRGHLTAFGVDLQSSL